MSGISGMGGNIAQLLGQNGQNANSTSGTDTVSGAEAFGSFALFSLQNSGENSSDAMTELTSKSEAITGQLSDSILSMLMELQETSTTTDGNSSFDAQQLFSDMDADGDGTLTKDEFMSAAPDDVSEEMSENLWNVMAGSDSDSISEEDYLAAMTPPPGAITAEETESRSDETLTGYAAPPGEDGTYDPLDTNEDGVVSFSEIMAAAPVDATPSASSLPDVSNEAEPTEVAAEQSEQPATTPLDPRNESFSNKLMAQVIS